jgi:hypothetical protein
VDNESAYEILVTEWNRRTKCSPDSENKPVKEEPGMFEQVLNSRQEELLRILC